MVIPTRLLVASLAWAILRLNAAAQVFQTFDFSADEDNPTSKVSHHNIYVHGNKLRISSPYANSRNYFYIIREDDARTLYFVDPMQKTCANLNDSFSDFQIQRFLDRPLHPEDACQDWPEFKMCAKLGGDRIHERSTIRYQVGDLFLWVDPHLDLIVKRVRNGKVESEVTNIQEEPVSEGMFELPPDCKNIPARTAKQHICKSLPALCPLTQPPSPPVISVELSDTGLESPPAIQDVPARIWLRPKRSSALPGQKLPIEVEVANEATTPVIADRDYVIRLEAGKAEVTPDVLTILRGESSAVASLRSMSPGEFRLSARSAELGEATQAVCVCDTGQIEHLVLNADRERASPNGERIQFSVVFTNASGTCVTDHTPKNVAIDLHGVGRLQSSKGFVSRDGCALVKEVFSFEPGSTTIKANLGNFSQEKTFLFISPLSLILIVLSLLGGMAGAFIQAAATFNKSRQWTRIEWVISLAVGATVGLCFFLFYYSFIVSRLAPALGSVKSAGFVLGLVAGFMGPVTLKRIWFHLFPPSIQTPTDGPGASAVSTAD